nr:zinc finger, CCHC-type [Tanacetum cinerariifolium]
MIDDYCPILDSPEIQTSVAPVLPISIEDAARSEHEIESALELFSHLLHHSISDSLSTMVITDVRPCSNIIAICGNFQRVFVVGPVFRAEDSYTRMHLCEFSGLDVDMEIKGHYSEYKEKTLKLTFEEGIQMLKVDPLGDLNTETERTLGKLVDELSSIHDNTVDKNPRSAFGTSHHQNSQFRPNSVNPFEGFSSCDLIQGCFQRVYCQGLLVIKMTTSSANNSVFRGFFEKQKLTGPNFIDWYRQHRIVLSIEDKLNYLEQPIPPAPVVPAGQHVAPEIFAAHTAWIKGSKEIDGLMLMTMELEIQRNLETLHAHEMLLELKTLFTQQAKHELLQTTRDFYSYKQKEWQSVSSYVLKMKGYIDNLECLGHPVTLGLGVSLILIGLPKEFDGFVQNYNMHSLWKIINELRDMLKLHEQTLPKNNAPALHAIRVGHWKRNCPQYLAELLKKKKNAASGTGGSGIFVIELNTILNRSWIYDTGCGTHICNTTQGLRASRKLKLGALSLYVGNGQREAVEAIGVFYLCLPSGLEIVLNNCHYAPFITRGVISVSRFKKRIEKLQHNGLLDSTDLRAFEKSVSCMSRKMARKPNTHQVERAKDLLGLIHTDICGPFKIMSRQGASYFVAPLTTSVDHGIITHRTPPYTPQHNGDLGEPANYKAALLDPESEKWLNAMNMEMQSMKDNEVWVLVELPTNGKTVGSKWLFIKKTDMDGVVHTYKAPLVAKGYSQTPGIDYEETFSPVADIRAIRILIAIAAYYDYEIWQMDVKTVFLNGYLNKEVYMEQPEGVKSYLGICLAMKDLGEAAYILRIKIYRDRSRRLIGLCQSAYIEKILKRYCMENFKRGSIRMKEKLKLSKSQGASTPAELKRMQNVPYASAVGFIMFVVRCTRPDVAFAQIVTSRFQQNQGDLHWTTVKNILKYLRNTKNMFLVYKGDLKRELRVLATLILDI